MTRVFRHDSFFARDTRLLGKSPPKHVHQEINQRQQRRLGEKPGTIEEGRSALEGAIKMRCMVIERPPRPAAGHNARGFACMPQRAPLAVRQRVNLRSLRARVKHTDPEQLNIT